jgi:small subunit ribosomal protein S20
MPHSANAKKRLRQNLRDREQNRATKSVIKTQIRKLLESIRGGDVKGANEQLRTVAKKVDQAAAARVVHPNRAARIKSRLSARILAASKASA